MFEVMYTVKDADGYLKEQKRKFQYLQDAIRFIRNITTGSIAGIIGKPTIERV